MAEESISRSSSSKRFGIGFSKDKEGKSKTDGSTKRSVKNFWGMKKYNSMKHKTAGRDDASSLVMKPPENSPPKGDGTARKRSTDGDEAPTPIVSEEAKVDEVKEVIKEEVIKDFANRALSDQTNPLLHKDDDEQKPGSSPTDSFSVLVTAEPKEKEKRRDLMAKAMDELQSLLHKQSDQEDTKAVCQDDQEQRDKLEKKKKKVIDEIHTVPLNEIRGPTLFERAKEEVEAVADVIRHKIEADGKDKARSNNDREAALIPGKNREIKEKEEGCEVALARGLQKICAPWSIN